MPGAGAMEQYLVNLKTENQPGCRILNSGDGPFISALTSGNSEAKLVQ